MALKVVAYNLKKTIGNGSFKIFIEFAVFLTAALQFSQVPGKETKKNNSVAWPSGSIGDHLRNHQQHLPITSNLALATFWSKK